MLRYRQQFNIGSPEQLGTIVLALEEAAEQLGWSGGMASFITSVGKFKFETKAQEDKVKQLQGRIKKYIQANYAMKQTLLKAQLPAFKEDLLEFKRRLDSKVTETEMHEWLKERTWIFGSDYMNQQPMSFSEVGWPGGSRFDFFLQRVDTFFDIMEMKSPAAKLFSHEGPSNIQSNFPSRESPISRDLQKAISQMIGYLERATIYNSAFLQDKGVLVLKPKGIIIIGRSLQNEVRAIKTLNAYLNQIEVLTYDGLLAKAREFVSTITKIRNRPTQPSGKRYGRGSRPVNSDKRTKLSRSQSTRKT